MAVKKMVSMISRGGRLVDVPAHEVTSLLRTGWTRAPQGYDIEYNPIYDRRGQDTPLPHPGLKERPQKRKSEGTVLEVVKV